jgi:hypothetical protein
VRRPVLFAVVLLGLSGCTGLDEANAAGIPHDDMVSATAAQLSRVTSLTYTATYQLAGGGQAKVTQAQDPLRTAYVFGSGLVLQTPTGTIRCTGTACTETAPAPATATPLPGGTLITPEAALALLNMAALDRDLDSTPRDTTIAGRHATCLDLRRVDGTPTDSFTLCVTNEGALAGFTATIAGKRYEQNLIRYDEKPDPSLLVPPAGATVADKRSKTDR